MLLLSPKSKEEDSDVECCKSCLVGKKKKKRTHVSEKFLLLLSPSRYLRKHYDLMVRRKGEGIQRPHQNEDRKGKGLICLRASREGDGTETTSHLTKEVSAAD